MTAPIDAVALAGALIACDSVTPARGPVFDVLADALAPLGFAVDRFVMEGVENLLATRAGTGAHLAFAGHLDVVPPGDGWTGAPFVPRIADDRLYGRGAADMKGAVAAFVAALSRVPPAGPVTLIVTGDEEGPALHGTRALMDRMAARGIVPDACIVGEPTCADRIGDTIKIGRRGSVNIWIAVEGRQGHVAYPHLADNPVPRLVAALAALDALVLDAGTDWFQPSNLEITEVTVANPAHNVIPARASARISIRFNDLHTGDALIDRVRTVVAGHAPGAQVTGIVSGEAFLTPPGTLSAALADAVHSETGVEPALSTTGGTSDARFLSRLCPTVEFGVPNATMHMVDESVALADLETLAAIYARVLRTTI